MNIRLEEAQARSNTETRHCRKYSQVQVPEPSCEHFYKAEGDKGKGMAQS